MSFDYSCQDIINELGHFIERVYTFSLLNISVFHIETSEAQNEWKCTGT